jgi:hypothetical protein
MIAARHLDEARIGDLVGEIAPARDLDPRVIGAMHDEGWNPDAREHVTDVDLGVHAGEDGRRRGTDRQSLETGPPRLEARVLHQAGRETRQ